MVTKRREIITVQCYRNKKNKDIGNIFRQTAGASNKASVQMKKKVREKRNGINFI
jgi:hypothetical protein